MKIFKKTKRANGKRQLYFFGVRIFSYTKTVPVTNNIDVWGYLKKYAYVLNLEHKSISTNKHKNVIWQLWFQGVDNAPDIVKQCLNSVKKFSGNRDVIVLTKDTLNKYIRIPDFIQEKYDKGIIPNAHFSDYIRVCLLAKYGGTWIDATAMLTSEIPLEITESEFFMFKSLSWASLTTAPSEKMFNYMPYFNLGDWVYDRKQCVPDDTKKGAIIAGSSWFLHSKQNNILCVSIKALLEEYWQEEDSLIDYFCFHYFISLAIVFCPKCQKVFQQMPSLSNVPPHLIQRVWYSAFDKNIFNNIKENSFVHKLTYISPEKDKLDNSLIKYIMKGNI